MTDAELTVLQKGRIPARIVLDEIEAYLAKYEGEEIEGGLIEGIAAKGGVTGDTIYTWLGQRRVQSIEFDVADRIMLYVVGSTWGRDPRFEQYYYGVDLSWKKCACEGCEVMVQEGRTQRGVTIRKYCSDSCRHAARNMRTGRTNRVIKRHRDGGMEEVCRNGHPRTPENTRYRRNGKRECVVCARAANTSSYRSRSSKRLETVRECEHPECSTTFPATRSDRRYCSDRCRDGARKFHRVVA